MTRIPPIVGPPGEQMTSIITNLIASQSVVVPIEKLAKKNIRTTEDIIHGSGILPELARVAIQNVQNIWILVIVAATTALTTMPEIQGESENGLVTLEPENDIRPTQDNITTIEDTTILEDIGDARTLTSEEKEKTKSLYYYF